MEPARSDTEPVRRLASERLIWRFRAAAAALAVAQTAVHTGESAAVSWTFVALLVASVAAARLALRGEPPDRRVHATGIASMAVDVAFIASTLANNLDDPANPIFMAAVLGTLEASMRWWFRGGALAGLAGGAAAGAWTIVVYERTGVDVVVGYATLRFGVLVVLGVFIGSIVERVNLERAALEASEQRFRSLFQHSADAVYSVDLNGCVTSANPATERLTGYSVAELAELGMAALVEPRCREEADRRFRLAAAGDAQGWEMVVRHRDGRPLDLDVTNVPIVVGGEVVGVYGVAKDVTERRRLERQLGYQARHDALTGLPNRLVLDELLQLVVDDRRGSGVALLFVDLDRFKVVNDSLGHRHGDQLLVAVVGRLQSCLRTGDVLVRWAGDEFCAVLPGAGRSETAVAVAERMLDALEEPVALAGREVRISASIGIAVATGPDDVDGLLLRADQAMYEAKRSGRSRIHVHHRGARADRHASDLLELEVRLRRAIERGELRLAYQPVVGVDDGRVVGFEALVRWPQADGVELQPADFVPLAEETGLVRGLTRWALGEACRQLASWDARCASAGIDEPPLAVSVNISAVDLAAPALVDEVALALAGADLDGRRLVLEVTETMLIDDQDAVAPVVAALQSMGVRLAIDDFGVGHSSLSQLQHLPVSIIKVDGAFLADAAPGSRGAAIVGSLLALSDAFGLPFVAEGVESRSQLEVLAAAGFPFAQGRLFAPAGTPDEVERFVLDRRVALDLPVSPARP